MRLDAAVRQLEGLVLFFENYRINGFISAMIDAKEISLEMGIEPVFPKKRQVRRKGILMRFSIVIGNNNQLKNHLELIIFLL